MRRIITHNLLWGYLMKKSGSMAKKSAQVVKPVGSGSRPGTKARTHTATSAPSEVKHLGRKSKPR